MPETVTAALTRDGSGAGTAVGLIYRGSSRDGVPRFMPDSTGPTSRSENTVFSVPNASPGLVQEGDLLQVPACAFTNNAGRQFIALMVRAYTSGIQCDLARFDTEIATLQRGVTQTRAAKQWSTVTTWAGVLRPVMGTKEQETANQAQSLAYFEWLMVPYPSATSDTNKIKPADRLEIGSTSYEVIGDDEHTNALLLVFRLIRIS